MGTKTNQMSPLETEVLTNTIRGMSEDQLRLVAQTLPINIMCEEITHRYQMLSDKLGDIANVMQNI